ncbi:26S proteasome non-ATPase regulatory subunit 9 [Glossina fuscipes]|uniref:26S proteasome non-ATPase regulatory subunit 9 n=1 Tax=Glossina fuscipes TaxID=7396 RepID=A0A8U0WHM6_9MUSC|nr:26S proteasome non-ATPase regulatory subunit 9 [Glossina fuscipes]
MGGVPNPNPTREKLLQLISDKDRLEARINDFGQILINNADIGMHGPLVDVEGYPRNDIDVHQVRQARQQIICLQNDHKALMNEIEKLMHKLHAETGSGEQTEQAQQQDADNETMEDSSQEDQPSISEIDLKVIVRVNHVAPGSPAEKAGLRNDDHIARFGTITSSNFNGDLQSIGALVKHMQNQKIPLRVLRNGIVLDMMLIPQSWSGRGLLGCNIVLNDD